MCTARPSWMSISQQKLGYKDKMYKVELGALKDVLRIDTDAMEVTVEPNVTIGFLNKLLVSKGVREAPFKKSPQAFGHCPFGGGV